MAGDRDAMLGKLKAKIAKASPPCRGHAHIANEFTLAPLYPLAPVAGLIAAKVFPEALAGHLPPMNSRCSLICGGVTVRGLLGTAVVMADFLPAGDMK
jgi:hypothetical protein